MRGGVEGRVGGGWGGGVSFESRSASSVVTLAATSSKVNLHLLQPLYPPHVPAASFVYIQSMPRHVFRHVRGLYRYQVHVQPCLLSDDPASETRADT